VNDHVIGVIRERAHTIGDEKTELPITEPQRPHPIRDLSPKNERKTFLIDNPTTVADFAALLS
jgi:hypothetical protein